MRLGLFRRSVVAATAVFLLVTGMLGCGNSAATSRVSGGTMTIRLLDDWGALDVQSVVSATAYVLSEAVYDRLLALGPGGKILPYLAESWKQTSTSVAFTIRKGATCADGTPVTPSVIGNSLKRFITVNPSQSRQFFGPGPYTITADDASRTLTVSLGTPYSDAIYGFLQPSTGVICPAGLADPKQLTDKSFGSGPFVIDHFTHGDSMTLKVRPEWAWGPYGNSAKTPGFPQQLVYRVVQNETTAANLLTTGGLDVAQISGQDVKRLQGTGSLNSNHVTTFYRYPLVMNETAGHSTSDETVREALMSAIDPTAWNQAAYGGLGQTGTSLFPSNWDCFDPATAKLVPQKASPDKAKAVLLAAGYTAGSNGMLQKDGKPLSLTLVAAQGQGSGPEYLQSQFQAAGITVNLRVVDPNTNSLSIRTGNYDLAIQRPAGVDPAPGESIALFSGPLPPKGTNYSFIIDPVVDQEVAAAEAATGSERCKHWQAVQEQFLRKHHLLPLAAPEIFAFARGIDFVQSGGLGNLEASSLRRRG